MKTAVFKTVVFSWLAIFALPLLAQSSAPTSNPGSLASPAPLRVSHAPQQVRIDLKLNGISALQLAWWFQHLADADGVYWKELLPSVNEDIGWIVNPREDAHQLIGAMYRSRQRVEDKAFPAGELVMQVLFADYVTQSRGFVQGQPMPLNPTLPVPPEYTPPFPSPLSGPAGIAPGLDSASNGFNQDLVVLDGKGFAPARILISWRNSGNDDTVATRGKGRAVELVVTLFQPWMEARNRPPAMTSDGYYFDAAQVQVVLKTWARMLEAMPAHLPPWYANDTQDELARAVGYTMSSVIDTGTVPGVDSKMMVWWWNHAMGDEPGGAYTLWCPPAHFAIRWLPGFSPSEVLNGGRVPDDHVVPGIIYPDLQGASLVQEGGGMMAYPPAMSPIPGRYKTINPMMIVSQTQVDRFDQERYPIPPRWLLHQWEDRPEGLIHRSTVLSRLPLPAPITQQGFYSEHQLLEGQFWGSAGMRRAYAVWRAGTHK